MDKFVLTIGQLVLSGPQDVYRQITKTFNDNPETDLFVFPEFATRHNINLNTVAYLQENADARAGAQQWLDLVPDFSSVKALSEKNEKAALIGCLAQDDNQLFSRAYYYDPLQEQLAFYDKSHVHRSEDFLRPGTRLEPIQTRFGKMGILICYDMAFVEPTRIYGIKGAEILAAISAIPMDFHWKYPHYRMIGAAIFNQYYVAAANLGYTLKAPMCGYSGIYSPEGDLIKQIRDTEFGYISTQIDLDHVRRWREKEMIDPYRKPHLYQTITAPIDEEG